MKRILCLLALLLAANPLRAQESAENELSLKEGFRLFSIYTVKAAEKLWIITEADRSVTTLLLPSEY